MRRTVLLIATAVFVSAASVTPLAAGRQSARPLVCPLAGSQVIPCCLPIAQPVACCATATVPCVAGLTIGSSRNPSTAGHPVTVSGRLLSGASGATVALWQELPGGTFTQVSETTTGANGDYSFLRSAVNTNRAWYATVGAIRSSTVSQEVRAAVTLTRSLHVSVSPNHAGERVVIQRRTKLGWKAIARLRLSRSSSTSTMTVAVLVRHGQSVRLRAVLPADKRNVESFSRVIRITR